MVLKRFHSYRKLAQTTIEYAVLFVVFAVAVLAMFQYTKAGIRAKFKFLGDEMRYGMSEEIKGEWATEQARQYIICSYPALLGAGKECPGNRDDCPERNTALLTRAGVNGLMRLHETSWGNDDILYAVCALYKVGCCMASHAGDFVSGQYILYWRIAKFHGDCVGGGCLDGTWYWLRFAHAK